jgi:PAS domain S-box-containing protein
MIEQPDISQTPRVSAREERPAWALIAVDPTGVITAWNAEATALYGWAGEEVVGRSIYDVLVPQVTQQQAAEIMARLVGGETWSGQFTVKRSDDSELTVEVIDTPVQQAGVTIAVVGMSRAVRVLGARPATVLIVEDDAAVADLLREVLMEEGYAVRVAASPAQALGLEHLQDVRLVIFDYRMGEMDGAAFYRELQARGIAVPGILCSAWRDGPAIAEELGVAYMKKPFDLTELLDVLGNLIDA